MQCASPPRFITAATGLWCSRAATATAGPIRATLSDWYDPRDGGHQALDDTFSGPDMRSLAIRALRRAAEGDDAVVSRPAAGAAADPSPAVRREESLAMRDVPAARSLDVLVEVATGMT